MEGEAGNEAMAGEDRFQTCHGAEEDGPISGREDEIGSVLRDDGPGGGVGGFPEVVVFRIVGGEEARFFTQGRDGPGFGKGEGGAGIILFKIGHGFGKQRGEGAGIFEVDRLERKAALLVEKADVAGREGGGFGGGIGDVGDPDAMTVADEGDFERTEFLKVAEGGIGPVDDEGLGLGNPVPGKGAGDFDEVLKPGRRLEIEKGFGGKFEAVFGSEEEAVEEGLVEGVGGISADDVDDRLGQTNGRIARFAVVGFLQKFAVEGSGEGFEKPGRAGEEVESGGGGHEERAWSMVREQPRGSAPGSRPRRVKERSGWPRAKSCVRIAATLWRLARS